MLCMHQCIARNEVRCPCFTLQVTASFYVCFDWIVSDKKTGFNRSWWNTTFSVRNFLTPGYIQIKLDKWRTMICKFLPTFVFDLFIFTQIPRENRLQTHKDNTIHDSSSLEWLGLLYSPQNTVWTRQQSPSGKHPILICLDIKNGLPRSLLKPKRFANLHAAC